MTFRLTTAIAGLVFFLWSFIPASDVFLTKNGSVAFTSDAPLELIEAENNSLGMVLDRSKKTVAAQVPIVNFNGFNSDLQKEHFNENYMESDTYSKSVFKGKIIEDVDLYTPGDYKVRVKGMLSIHGVDKERIISGRIKVSEGAITVKTTFEVALADHDIAIPRIVTQKIAETVTVELNASLAPQS
ncbi:MAG: hypothetical protein Salg2KO_09870 [Salibacteraceae bacterium]